MSLSAVLLVLLELFSLSGEVFGFFFGSPSRGLNYRKREAYRLLSSFGYTWTLLKLKSRDNKNYWDKPRGVPVCLH